MFSSVCRYTVYHLNVTNRVLVLYLTTKKKLIMRATFVFALKLRDYQDNVDNSYFSLVVHKQLTLDDGNFYWTNYCDRQLFLIQTCILNFILISILLIFKALHSKDSTCNVSSPTKNHFIQFIEHLHNQTCYVSL